MFEFFLRLFFVVVFIVLYAIGGQGYRWTKKWVGPSVFGISVIGISILTKTFGWLLLAGSLLYLVASNSFSYGEKWTQGKFWKKILFRGLSGLMYGISGILIGISLGDAVLGIAQLAMAVSISIIFGVFNPFGSKFGNWSTVLEDICIAFGFVGLIPFMGA